MHFPVLIQDLAVILGVAAVVTFLFRLIKQPVVLGYIVAGIIVGPHTPAVFSVTDTENIKVWAELGVIFLMFTLGLEFSFRRLTRVGMSAGVTAVIQIVAMLTWGFVAAEALGWTRMDAIFLGCMISISSTTIIIKALEELGLKTKKFAELVFGILIVEDLAAILMLVALTNIATTSQIGGIELLLAGGKLAIVVGAWFLVGMFVVPRFIRSVSRHGNDEMLVVVALSLCLALVALAAFFHYSVALGAFIMGSILAESSESKRIEHLVQPLKDIFGAVFFVSVGMLLDPKAITQNLGAVALLSAVIILGKVLSVTIGAFLTGQTVRHAVQTGFSMAQIGEFSFIIASLGLTYGAISEKLYPIIVAASLVTTFTTPYLVRSATRAAETLEARLPARARNTLNNYVSWVQRLSVTSDRRKALYGSATKWALNAIVVITLFTVGADKLIPMADEYLVSKPAARGLVWFIAFVLSAPSIWAMLSSFRAVQGKTEQRRTLPRGSALLLGSLMTIGLVGLLSVAYFPANQTMAVTLGICGLLFVAFHRQVEGYYRWIEQQFQSGFQAELRSGTSGERTLERLAPWDAHLVELKVPARSFVVGRSLLELKLREQYGLNIVVIVRDGENIVAPKASEPLYPSDRILCFATDVEVERFKRDIEASSVEQDVAKDLEAYDIRRLRVEGKSRLRGASIRQSGIREAFDCIVVGLERGEQRLRSPGSDLELAEGDVLWIVGEPQKLQALEAAFAT
jgi:CPA2 family monovalent cation:H+ antiporter-2